MKFDRFFWKALRNILIPILITAALMAYIASVFGLIAYRTVPSVSAAIAMIAIPAIAILLFYANDDAKNLRNKDEYRRKVFHRHDH